MNQVQSARRYALAFVKTAQSRSLLTRAHEDLSALQIALFESEQLQKTLTNPVYTAGEKKQILRRLFEKDFHPLTLDFLNLICEKRREDILPEIITEFMRQWDEITGALHIQVTTAHALNPDQTEMLRLQIQKATGKQPVFTFELDPNLIGGVKLQIGSRILDGSVRRQMERLKEEFLICKKI